MASGSGTLNVKSGVNFYSVFSRVLSFLPLVGPIVAGVQQIHGDAVAGATKKQMALEALGLAKGVGDTVGTLIPGGAAGVDAAAGLASTLIDGWVDFYKAVGWSHPAAAAVIPQVLATPTSISVTGAGGPNTQLPAGR